MKSKRIYILVKNVTLLILIITGLFSCDYIDGKAKSEKLEQQLGKENKDRIIATLVEKYNILACWDTLNFNYTSEFQEKYQDKFMLMDNILIQDIYIKNDLYYASITAGYTYGCIFDFSISQDDYKKLQKSGIYEIDADAILVVKVMDLEKIRLSIKSNVYQSEDETGSLIVEFEGSDNFIGRGEIVEVQLIQ